jgi:hypothetical protein
MTLDDMSPWFELSRQFEPQVVMCRAKNGKLLTNKNQVLARWKEHDVIQQAWTSETLPRSWTEGVLCPVYKKGDKLDCKNYQGICLLNVTYKVFAKILYVRLLPHANAAVQHYQAGVQSGKSTNCTAPNLRKMQ